MLNLIYTLKACMLCIYNRLTTQLRVQRFVKALSIYVACGYVGTQFAFFFACRPFKGYWAMPPPSRQCLLWFCTAEKSATKTDMISAQCTTLQHYAEAQACFNISSDAFMLAISLPLLLTASLPLKQKIVLTGIFGMGTFIVSAGYPLSSLHPPFY